MKKNILTLVLALTTSGLLACEYGDISFLDDFSTARLDGCKKLSANNYLLTIDPENEPINPSPWFAFQVKASKQKHINIEIDYGKAKSRYLPKVSRDGKSWQQVKYKVKDGDLKFKLKLKPGITWVSAQEIISNEFYVDWLDALGNQNAVDDYILGHSVQKRHIRALESHNDSNEWVVVLGRMHPPEVTGAVALFPFVERLLSNSELATKFRSRFNILVVPNLNPDGVELGNWRHNANGVDLNRDWLKFEQPETQMVKTKIEQIVSSGGKIVYAIDFHSTSKNIFYTMPEDYGLHPADMTVRWLKHLDEADNDFQVVMQAGNNPNKGVFKQYIADQYGVHAITYEMDDDYPRNLIKSVAKKAADSFMETMMATPKNDFE